MPKIIRKVNSNILFTVVQAEYSSYEWWDWKCMGCGSIIEGKLVDSIDELIDDDTVYSPDTALAYLLKKHLVDCRPGLFAFLSLKSGFDLHYTKGTTAILWEESGKTYTRVEMGIQGPIDEVQAQQW